MNVKAKYLKLKIVMLDVETELQWLGKVAWGTEMILIGLEVTLWKRRLRRSFHGITGLMVSLHPVPCIAQWLLYGTAIIKTKHEVSMNEKLFIFHKINDWIYFSSFEYNTMIDITTGWPYSTALLPNLL